MILKKGKINVRNTDGSVESVDILTGGISGVDISGASLVQDGNGKVNIPIATHTNNTAGAVLLGDGFWTNTNGKTSLNFGTESDISNRSTKAVVSTKNINYAIKAALTDDKRDNTYTDLEKSTACKTIGALNENSFGTNGIPLDNDWTVAVAETTVTTVEDPYKEQRPSGTNIRYWITLASGGSFYCDALYKVTYNGTEYKNLVAKYCFFDDNGIGVQHSQATDSDTSGSYYSVGNRALYDSRYQNTGEPFCLVYVPYGGARTDGEYYYTHIANSCLLFTSSVATATVKVEKCAANINPINPALLGNYGRCDIPFEKMQGSSYPRVSIGCANIVGRGSYAIGEGNLSTGQFALASGYNAYAIGEMSFAHGFESKSTKESSIAFGVETLADRPSSIALGYGNESMDGTDNLFVVGNGSKINRSNALELDIDGKLTTNKVESNALVIASQDGTKWKLTVENDGSISTSRCEYSLPSGYTRKNWVQSAGSCTLDTGYYFNIKTNFRGCAMKSENNNMMIAAFQTIDGTKLGIGIGFMGADSTVVFTRRRIGSVATAKITNSGKLNFDLSFNTSLLGNYTIESFGSGDPFIHTESFKLYNSTPAGMRIYDFRIYEDHECLHKYIPCTDANGVVCLFDAITGETKYAIGTALICG